MFVYTLAVTMFDVSICSTVHLYDPDVSICTKTKKKKQAYYVAGWYGDYENEMRLDWIKGDCWALAEYMYCLMIIQFL